MLVEVELEVTVIFTTLTTPTGVPVMEKSLEAVVELTDLEKKLLEVPSGAAVTAMVTPLAGIADFMVTFKLKGPTAGTCVVLIAGVVVTERVASGALLLPPQLERKGKKAMVKRISKKNFPADRCFIKRELIQNKVQLFFKDLNIAAKTFIQGNKGLRTLDPLYFLQLVMQHIPQLIDVLTGNLGEHTVITRRIVQSHYFGYLLQLTGDTVI